MVQVPQHQSVKKNKELARTTFRLAFIIAIVGLLLLPLGNALGWNAGGHMMVAKIAYDRLNPRAKAEADRLMKIQIGPTDAIASNDFINAAHWPDDIKSSKTFPHFDKDHYIDYPFSPDGTPLPTNQPDAENIIKALNEDIQILKTSTDDKAKAQALRFLIHFVGDIHQPLHATTRVTKAFPNGDRGGNDFHLDNERLHAYWDNGADTFPKTSPPPEYAPPPLSEILGPADRIVKEYPETDQAWKTGGPTDFVGWSKESFEIATHSVYNGLTENAKPGAEYTSASIKIIDKRIAWAGYRLATLLNTLWPETK